MLRRYLRIYERSSLYSLAQMSPPLGLPNNPTTPQIHPSDVEIWHTLSSCPLRMNMSYLRHSLMDFSHPGFVWNAFLVVSMPIAFVSHYSSTFVIVSQVHSSYPITMKMQYLRQFPMVSHRPGLISNAFYNVLNALPSVFTFVFTLIAAFVVAANIVAFAILAISQAFPHRSPSL